MATGLGSSVCEWMRCLTMSLACWQCLSLLFSWWVAKIPCCLSGLLTMPVLDSPVCEWLRYLAVFLAYWQCPSLVLQSVSGWGCLVGFLAYWQWLFLALQDVSSCGPCGASLCFEPANNAYFWLSSMWVVVVSCYLSSLLTMPVLGSPASEWLWCFSMLITCWQCLFLALQLVSGVAVVLHCVFSLLKMDILAFSECEFYGALLYLSLLTMPVLGSPACKWLWCLSIFLACWQNPSLALQSVSGYGALLYFYPVNNTCLWLSRKWVAVMPCCISSLLTMWQCLSLALQLVSGWGALLYF